MESVVNRLEHLVVGDIFDERPDFTQTCLNPFQLLAGTLVGTVNIVRLLLKVSILQQIVFCEIVECPRRFLEDGDFSFMLIPELAHKQRYEEVTTDAGYESLDNYLYLEANGQMSFIKPSNYEAEKTKKFRAQIGWIENMKYDQEDDCFICAEGRKPYCRKVSTEMKNGIPVTRAWYRCENCQNCPQWEKCCKKQDINAPKEIIWKKTFWEKRRNSLENITSERGIVLHMNRSIQVEGAFGLLKNDFGFRRFMTTGKRNIRIELFFLALGFNLKKRWMKQQKTGWRPIISRKKFRSSQTIKVIHRKTGKLALVSFAMSK